ncbi:MAG: hypothetical protein AAF533_26605 [Acidobacteriota bacterium]
MRRHDATNEDCGRSWPWRVLGLVVALTTASPLLAGLPAPPVEEWTRTTATPVATPVVEVDPFSGPILYVLTLDGRAYSFRGNGDVRGGHALVDGVRPLLAIAVVDGTQQRLLLATDTELIVRHVTNGPAPLRHPWPSELSGGQANLGVVDLDGDGLAEVHVGDVVLSADGSGGWSGGTSTSLPLHCNAVDLLPAEPGQELACGTGVFAADGRLLWSTGLDNGSTALGDLDGDDTPELVVTALRSGGSGVELHVFDALGTPRISPLVLSTSATSWIDAPALVDLDSDTRPELLVSTPDDVQAHDWEGGELVSLWSVPVETNFAVRPGLTAFDFDGDESAEVIVTDASTWRILDGLSGDALHEADFLGAPGRLRPVVTNLDDDAAAEIVLCSTEGLVVHEIPGSIEPRTQWNQHDYHGCNVEDDLVIPTLETPPWQTHRTWGAQVEPNDCESCRLRGVRLPPEVVGCRDEESVIDGTTLRLDGCPEPASLSWIVEGMEVSTDPILRFTASVDVDVEVVLSCPSLPGCEARTTTRLLVDEPPTFEAVGTAALCPEVVRVSWTPALWHRGEAGTYSLYRSTVSCEDALANPPLVSGLSSVGWRDRDVVTETTYYYVLEAESALRPNACDTRGPGGGLVGQRCLPPVTVPVIELPETLEPVLRVRKSGDRTVVSWDDARPLAAEETFVLRESEGPTGPALQANFPRATLRSHSIRNDDSPSFACYTVHVAGRCGHLSPRAAGSTCEEVLWSTVPSRDVCPSHRGASWLLTAETYEDAFGCASPYTPLPPIPAPDQRLFLSASSDHCYSACLQREADELVLHEAPGRSLTGQSLVGWVLIDDFSTPVRVVDHRSRCGESP